ncbi:MAG: hypothetical protein RL021_795 [Bacteroidota bacterium]|jgi:hypothetical protein
MINRILNKEKVMLIVIFSLSVLSACKHEALECDPNAIVFERDIQPILISNCTMEACHDAVDPEEGIDLTSYEAMMSSDEAIDPGNPSNSDLLESIKETDPSDRMPKGLPPLTAEQIRKIELWISLGAKNEKCNF